MIKAICPMCGQLYDVTDEGLIEDHVVYRLPATDDPLIKSAYCLGSGMEAM